MVGVGFAAGAEQVAEAALNADRCRRHRDTVLVHREGLEDIVVVVRLVHATFTVAAARRVVVRINARPAPRR